MRQKKRGSRDPYYYWKVVNMILACAVLLLAILILLGGKGGWIVLLTYALGCLMCTLSGIMELAKGKRVTGYLSAVFAGILVVALIIHVIRIW